MHQRVQVAVRVRRTPSDTENCVFLDEEKGFVSVRGTEVYSATEARRYHEDVLLGQELSNRAIFERLLLPKLSSATIEHPETLCFLAYGHTNSGKTHTIAGGNGETGILTLCVEELIRKSGIVEISMVEVYMEEVYDLLADGKVRQIRRHYGPQGTTIVVENLFTRSIVSLAQWEAVTKYGMRSRRTAATDRNTRSSRSHAVFTIKSKAVRVCFVDLAGSERQTLFSPKLNKESISINKSLSRLSTVLEALSTQRVREDSSRSYVNFRDTMLTVLLQRYLCGASLTTFLACVHPSPEFFRETLSTLRYTQRLKRIHTLVPQPGGPGDVSAIAHSEHQELIEELARLHQQVREERDNTKLAVQAHLHRITVLEEKLKQQSHASAVLSSNNSVHQNIVSDNFSRDKALKAKDTKRVVGWLVSRILGNLPQINVGYDEYFDSFFPPKIQVIGYLSIMACLAPRAADDNSLAFLDVGDLSMGLSMVDASIPPFVRLHRVPCRNCAAWDGQEFDAQGHMLYVLAFFEVNGEVMKVITERDNKLECCGGYLSLESLLPIAIVLCVATSSPSYVKEAALQWLIALQGEQEAATWRRVGSRSSASGRDTPCNDSLSCHSENTDNARDKANAFNVDIIMSPQSKAQDTHGDEYYDSSLSGSFSEKMPTQGDNMLRRANTLRTNSSSSSASSKAPTFANVDDCGNATKPAFIIPDDGIPNKAHVIGASDQRAMSQQPLGGNIASLYSLNVQASSTATVNETNVPSKEAKTDFTKQQATPWRTSNPATYLKGTNKSPQRMHDGVSRGSRNVVKFENCHGCHVA
ncbi:unnamed protein product [Phytomonas sp. EM1]|nr:unnamed protein product [Phytomonas sp. EM1]|eukprot:CCW64911.1 unnamed protein product [Phytomonas sp. isolate EM1]